MKGFYNFLIKPYQFARLVNIEKRLSELPRAVHFFTDRENTELWEL